MGAEMGRHYITGDEQGLSSKYLISDYDLPENQP